MLDFKGLRLNLLNLLTLTLKIVLGDHPTRLKTISTILRSKTFKSKLQIDRNIVVPTVCVISRQNVSQIIYESFGHVSIARQ